jgi:hypothetical protein
MRVRDVFARLPKWIATLGVFVGVALGGQIPASAGGPTTSIQTEYLMTIHAPMGVAQFVDQSLRIVNVPAGGWVEGPRIKGEILGPSGDWLRAMPSGILRIDVRTTIQTEDGELIFTSYNGVMQCSKEQIGRFSAGEELKAGDCYLITAPTFETKSEKYDWLNAVQAVGKMRSFKRGDHIEFDIFLLK